MTAGGIILPSARWGSIQARSGPKGQLSDISFLTGDSIDKYARLDTAVDEIRKRYGEDCVQRAVFVGTGFPHVGGIDKVKRTGVTKAVQRPGPGSGAGDRNHGSGEDRVFR